MAQCAKLVSIDISRNALQQIPGDIVQLPLLRNLNVSRNQLCELPECTWSNGLALLDVNENELSNLPMGLQHTSLNSLKMKSNRFSEVGQGDVL